MEDSVLKQKGMKKGITEEIATRKRALNFYSLANILPDPDIVLKKQGKDIRIYKELLCDPHVFACIQSRKAGILSLEWEINRGLDKAKDAENYNYEKQDDSIDKSEKEKCSGTPIQAENRCGMFCKMMAERHTARSIIFDLSKRTLD